MAEHVKYTKTHRKEIPSIFAGLSIAKLANRQQQAKLSSSTGAAHFNGKPPIAAQMISLQLGPQPSERPKQRTVRPKRSKRTAANLSSRFFCHVPFTKSRRQEKRLRSVRKHLLINLPG
jgi:hypothetical protein